MITGNGADKLYEKVENSYYLRFIDKKSRFVIKL